MRKRILVLTIILSILIGFIFSFYYYEIKNLLIEIIFPDEYRKESEKIAKLLSYIDLMKDIDFI
ncbi:MAG: hypothetical protein QXY18_02980, partial [Nitrososphaerota archaeon]